MKLECRERDRGAKAGISVLERKQSGGRRGGGVRHRRRCCDRVPIPAVVHMGWGAYHGALSLRRHLSAVYRRITCTA